MINVALAIDGEAQDAVLSRRAPGSYDANGEGVPGALTVTPIRAAVQPAKGNQLMDLPEGIRAEARWLLWSRTSVLLDDVITHDGFNYRVLFTWRRAEGGFTRAALGLVK